VEVAVSHLRLAHPAPPKQPRRKGRSIAPVFSPDDENRLRAALKNARPKFGTWACLADALRLAPKNLQRVANNPRRRVSAEVAVRLARALGVPVESLLRAPTDAGRCPTCGAVRGPT
jgi:hypothetical protein